MAIKKTSVGFVVVSALLQVAVVACSSDTSQGPATESLGETEVALARSGDPTDVVAGSPSPRQPTCPGKKLPDQCGSWAGVELSATSSYLRRTPPFGLPQIVPAVDDELCVCAPIEFQIPQALPVTLGNSGHGRAELEFRLESGRSITCHYRGDEHDRSPGSTNGKQYRFENCERGYRAGATVKADFFELEIDHGDTIFAPTRVDLRLGEPDVVGGEVREAVYYSDDPALAGAALYVPRGTAPAFQDFSLTRLPEPVVESKLANGGAPFTTLGPAVDVHAVGVDNFVFTPVPGAQCPRIELPYSPEALERVLGAGKEALLRGRQITSISGAMSGAAALAPVGGITVDQTRKTISFCVEHLSFYVAGSDSDTWEAFLVLARLDVTNPTDPSNLLDGRDLLAATLPTLDVGSVHTLTLEFRNDSTNGQIWSQATDPRLVSVGQWTTGQPSDALSAWFPNAAGMPTQVSNRNWDKSTGPYNAAGSTVAPGERARFHFQITAPQNGSLLNLCLKQGSEAFGYCFSWFPNTGLNGSTIIANQLQRPCYTGAPETRGKGRCRDGVQRSRTGGSWPADTAANCIGQVLPGTEVCDGVVDEDCDDEVDEGLTSTFYADSDGDGYGDASAPLSACSAPSGYVTDATDCNDKDGANHALGTYYPDCDEDTYGGNESCWMPRQESTRLYEFTVRTACGLLPPQPYEYAGSTYYVPYVTNNTDCFNYSPYIHPGAAEVCDYTDNNCVDGTNDENRSASYRYDRDFDGWCTPEVVMGCPGITPSYTRPSETCSKLESPPYVAYDDCNDSNPYADYFCGELFGTGSPTYSLVGGLFGATSEESFLATCQRGWHITRCEAVRTSDDGNFSTSYCPVGDRENVAYARLGIYALGYVEGHIDVYCEPDATAPFP